MQWWAWILLGFVLLCLELFLPTGFFLFLFGAAALVVGLLLLAGLPLAGWLQWVLCAVVAVAFLLSVRRKLLAGLGGNPKIVSDELSGKVVTLSGDIEPGQSGSGELRGSSWRVKNLSSGVLRRGDMCIVDQVEGLTLLVSRKA